MPSKITISKLFLMVIELPKETASNKNGQQTYNILITRLTKPLEDMYSQSSTASELPILPNIDQCP
jgi:hypothetical protein